MYWNMRINCDTRIFTRLDSHTHTHKVPTRIHAHVHMLMPRLWCDQVEFISRNISHFCFADEESKLMCRKSIYLFHIAQIYSLRHMHTFDWQCRKIFSIDSNKRQAIDFIQSTSNRKNMKWWNWNGKPKHWRPQNEHFQQTGEQYFQKFRTNTEYLRLFLNGIFPLEKVQSEKSAKENRNGWATTSGYPLNENASHYNEILRLQKSPDVN